MDDEEQAIKDIHINTVRVRGRVKGVAAQLAGLRNLTNLHALVLAEELAALGLAFESLSNDLRFAIRTTAAGLDH